MLYAVGQNNEIFENFSVPQENLYDGNEYYIRISGCGFNQNNSNDSILSKIAESKKLLKDIADIKQGIVSGADKYTDAHEAKYGLGHPKGKGIFVLPKEQLMNLNFPAEEKKRYLKKIYKNSQISKYSIAYSDDLYVLYLTKEVGLTDAPKMIEYLEQFKPILAAKREAVEGKMPWYSLNWAREKSIFEAKEKIVNSRRSKGNIFALDTKQCYEQSDIMITVIKKEYQKEYPPKYVLGLLNSKLYYFWLKNRGKLKGDMLELYGKPLEEIPIINASEDIKANIVECVTDLLEENGHNDVLLGKIDRLVYKACDLTDEEIKIVEGE